MQPRWNRGGFLAYNDCFLLARARLGTPPSQKYILPFLSSLSDRDIFALPKLALAAIYCEIRDEKTSPYWNHFQLSSANNLVFNKFGIRHPYAWSLKKTLLAPVLNRLYVSWGSLHSDHSPTITLKKKKGTPGENTLIGEGVMNRNTREIVSQLGWKFSRNVAYTGLSPLLPTVRMGLPGAGSHYGGTLKMRNDPSTPIDTDVNGRLNGTSNIHIIDASTFPSIPATTIALSTAANAHRIRSNVPIKGHCSDV